MSATATEFDKAAFQEALKKYVTVQQRREDYKKDFAGTGRLLKEMLLRNEWLLNMVGCRIFDMAKNHREEAMAAAEEIEIEITLPEELPKNEA
jgi:hypothetical protein